MLAFADSRRSVSRPFLQLLRASRAPDRFKATAMTILSDWGSKLRKKKSALAVAEYLISKAGNAKQNRRRVIHSLLEKTIANEAVKVCPELQHVATWLLGILQKKRKKVRGGKRGFGSPSINSQAITEGTYSNNVFQDSPSSSCFGVCRHATSASPRMISEEAKKTKRSTTEEYVTGHVRDPVTTTIVDITGEDKSTASVDGFDHRDVPEILPKLKQINGDSDTCLADLQPEEDDEKTDKAVLSPSIEHFNEVGMPCRVTSDYGGLGPF